MQIQDLPIRKLSIKNFKSIKDQKFECKKINLFLGKPNVGKSNILEALGLLSYANHGNIRNNLDSFVRFENLRDLFFDHLLDQPLEVDFGPGKFSVRFVNGHFKAKYEKYEERNQAISPTVYDIFTADYTKASIHNAPQDLKKFKFYRFRHLSKFDNSLSEFLQPPDGDNLLSIVMTNKQVKKTVKEMFEEFGYRINLRPEDGKIDFVKEYEDVLVSFPYSLSSETLQRMVFYIAAMLSNQNAVITFEEPEAHAFPFYTKILAERIALSERNNQYFIATHNPYLLTSILEKAPKDQVAVSLITLQNYETIVTTLDEEKKTEILEMGTDTFFNFDKLLDKGNPEQKPKSKD